MSEIQSALSGASYDGAVKVTEGGLRGMITLKGDLGSATLQAAAKALTSSDFPEPGTATMSGESGLLWMAPDEILILLPYADVGSALSTLAEKLAGEPHLAANVSDARAVFTLSGPPLRDVLAKLTPADVSARGFPVGAFRRTRFAQVPAALWMRDDTTADLICFRSVAEYMFNLLSNAADPAAPVDHFTA